MSWNYRVLKEKNDEEGGDRFFIAEVYYDETDEDAGEVLTGYVEDPKGLYAGSRISLLGMINNIRSALLKPVLNVNDFYTNPEDGREG